MEQFVNALKSVSVDIQIEEYQLSEESIYSRTLSPENLKILQTYKVDNKNRLFLAIVNRVVLEKLILVSKELSLTNLANRWIYVLTERYPIQLLSDSVKNIAGESDILLVQNVQDQDCLMLKLDCTLDMIEEVLRKAVHKVFTNTNFNFKTTTHQAKNRLLSESKVSVLY